MKTHAIVAVLAVLALTSSALAQDDDDANFGSSQCWKAACDKVKHKGKAREKRWESEAVYGTRDEAADAGDIHKKLLGVDEMKDHTTYTRQVEGPRM